jgi:5,10-methylene-tetrahydrofolate dehydrogenase/methenyl tetrahydrofolate cyclohydrolase
MIINGKEIAEDIYSELAPKFAGLGRSVKLGILVVGANPVIESFVKIKTQAAERLGIEMVRVNVSDKSDAGKIQQAADRLVATTDAAIIQLPLPQGINTNEVLSIVPKEKDVDALNPAVSEEERPVHAPVALAVVEILTRSGVEIAGKRTVVVGAGRLVGAPSAWLLRSLGADVSVFSLEEGSIEDLKEADIVVSGAGNPGFIKPEHLKQGVALIDAGTSELNKKITGDADPRCAEIASVFSPVPGGVGPVAVAMIFRNLYGLLREKNNYGES